MQAQVSAVQGIAVDDLNNDGKPDLFLVGNKWAVEVETGRCDAGTGCFLEGDGKGGFRWIPNTSSGLWARQNARSVAVLKGQGGRKTVIVGNNNDAAEVYSKGGLKLLQ
ncbi:MAG: hypothetical protein IPL65_15540 [Lewinellaceae bacterium]|nr:hypothetical protein [Lewinellaceae bacterium]